MKYLKFISLKVKIVFVVLFVAFLFIGFFIFSGNPKDIGAIKTFKADVKVFSLNTDIVIRQDGEKLYHVKGNIFRFIEDPLTLYNTEGDDIAYGDDSFHVIEQDTHWITTIYGEEIKMVGNFNFFGNSYDLYMSGEQIARVQFNATDTYGELIDMAGNIMADYSSKVIFKDYIVQVTPYNTLSDVAVNMIFASYYSDKNFDSNSN